MSFKVVLYVRLLPSCLVVHIQRIEYVASHYIRRAKTEVCAEHRLNFLPVWSGCICALYLDSLLACATWLNDRTRLRPSPLSCCWCKLQHVGSKRTEVAAVCLLGPQCCCVTDNVPTSLSFTRKSKPPHNCSALLCDLRCTRVLMNPT